MYQMNYKSSRFKTFVMCFSHVVCKRVFLVHWQALSLAQPLGSHNVEGEKKRREGGGRIVESPGCHGIWTACVSVMHNQ